VKYNLISGTVTRIQTDAGRNITVRWRDDDISKTMTQTVDMGFDVTDKQAKEMLGSRIALKCEETPKGNLAYGWYYEEGVSKAPPTRLPSE
jgi:hypothetical protein